MNHPWLTTIDCPVSALLRAGEEQDRVGDIYRACDGIVGGGRQGG